MSLLDRFRRGAAVPHTPAVDPREAFRAEVEAVLRADPEVTSVAQVPGEFVLTVERAGVTHHVFLGNVFEETRELSPEQRGARVATFVNGTIADFDSQPDWEEARGALVPLLRTAASLFVSGPPGERAAIPMTRPFAPFLPETVAVDRPASLGYVDMDDVERWGVTAADVFDAARQNAEALRRAELAPYHHTGGRVLHVPGDEPWAASRLLLPGWLASLRGRVDGRPLAAAPERGTLLVAGDASPDLVRWLAEFALREWRAAARALSPALYTVDDAGAVVPYVRPGVDPLAHLVREGHVALQVAEYAAQKETLEAEHERDGVELFVAKCTGIRLEGRPVTCAAWPDGVETLVPLADAIVVGETDAWSATVPFEVARRVAGPLWTAADVAGPPRFRATGRLGADQKRALRAADVPLSELP